MNPDDPTRIIGVGTSFTAKISARCQIMLPANHGNATVEVTAVESDTQLVVKKPFSPKISQTFDSSEKVVNYKVWFPRRDSMLDLIRLADSPVR